MRKSKDAAEVKSLPQVEQILDLTQDEETEMVPKEANPAHLSSDLPLAERSLDKTLAEIDAEIAADKEAEVSVEKDAEVVGEKDAEVVLPESSVVLVQPSVNAEDV